MTLVPYDEIIKKLESRGIKLDNGLSDDEVSKIESFYEIKFPKVLKEFYILKLPVSNGFYNWRDFNSDNVERIKDALSWPLVGMLFDIEHNQFWIDDWGTRPKDLEHAKKICCENIKSVPTLIPINGHRYMPYVEKMDNPPVLSVYQTDIIYYGSNLNEYIKTEFGMSYVEDVDYDSIETIPFWTRIIMEEF